MPASTSGSADTYPRLLMKHAQVRGDRTAMREKDLGIWQTWTWQQSAGEVRALACGLAALGFRPRHAPRDHRRQPAAPVLGDAAAQASAAFRCRCTRTPSPRKCVYVLDDAEIEFAIVEDQEQVDKLLEMLPQCPRLRHIIYDDPRGLRHYEHAELLSL